MAATPFPRTPPLKPNPPPHRPTHDQRYKLFLDDTLTYSAGIHDPADDALPGAGTGGPGDAGLRAAQVRKLDALIKAAGVKKGDHVLEIGCGWGSLAIRAAQTTGCTWTGVTLSKQQLQEANARVAAAGVADRVRLLLCDYRDVRPPAGASHYDAVVSCEMIEAVGHEHMATYFATIGRLLKPGGAAAVQAICVPDGRYEAYAASSDFIREHIFPGGHLPSMGAMLDAAVGTGLTIEGTADVGPDYAQTLRAWRAAWEARRADVLALGYSPRFWRKYRFYFAYCEAAFDAKYIHDFQVTWRKCEGDGRDPAEAGAPRADGGEAPAKSSPALRVLLGPPTYAVPYGVNRFLVQWSLDGVFDDDPSPYWPDLLAYR